MVAWTRVADVTFFQTEGARRVVDVDGVRVAVFSIAGAFLAVEDVCSHDGGEIASGEIVGNDIVCPRHGARFCLRTGEALCAPAYEPIAIFPIKVEDGIVWVRDERWD